MAKAVKVGKKIPARRNIVRNSRKENFIQQFVSNSLRKLRAMYLNSPAGLSHRQIMALAKAEFRYIMEGLIKYLAENKIVEKFRRHGNTDCYRLIGEIPKFVPDFQFATAFC